MRKILPFVMMALLPACKGCTSAGDPPKGTTTTASASASAKAKRAPRATPPPDPTAWLRKIPHKKPEVKAGDRVWALVPTPGTNKATFNVWDVDSVQDETVTVAPLVRADGKLKRDEANKKTGAPGPLITPAAPLDAAKIKAGDLVVAAVPGLHAAVALVTKIAGASAEVKYVDGDKVADATVDHAIPLAQGIQPFAVTVFLDNGTFPYREMLVAAAAGDMLFGTDRAGVVHAVDRRDAKAVAVQLKDRKKGDTVVAFDAGGAVDARIEAEITPRLLYTIRMRGAPAPVPFFAIFDKI